MTAESAHETVLMQEAIDALSIREDGIYVDTTFGRGGHSRSILERLGPEGRLIVFDKDPDAIEVANRMQEKDARIEIMHAPFGEIESQVSVLGVRRDRRYLIRSRCFFAAAR